MPGGPPSPPHRCAAVGIGIGQRLRLLQGVSRAARHRCFTCAGRRVRGCSTMAAKVSGACCHLTAPQQGRREGRDRTQTQQRLQQRKCDASHFHSQPQCGPTNGIAWYCHGVPMTRTRHAARPYLAHKQQMLQEVYVNAHPSTLRNTTHWPSHRMSMSVSPYPLPSFPCCSRRR